ncbi:MAG: VanZ family protein [Candidatus Omnitrophica bacterium]|nr:VanZ family protein [Candidatus Omnitrophota bacterium]MBI3022003.1 VanZ family protein [Candidatus Omnitrophota bacterium]MBI3084098.1 VanZ family protein [Candidatus Omnitrophota bacterium]
MPVGPGPSIRHLDKVAHLGEYLLFAWLMLQALRASQMPRRVSLWWAWGSVTGYGLVMEGVQAMLPWRSAELADVVANGCGALLGVWIRQHLPGRS